MASTDSCWALSINEQVLTTMMSASSARGVIAAPPCASKPIMTSLSTRFLGQPRLMKPTFWAVADAAPSSGGYNKPTESCLEGMQSLDFIILKRTTGGVQTTRHRRPCANFRWYDAVGRALVPRNAPCEPRQVRKEATVTGHCS